MIKMWLSHCKVTKPEGEVPNILVDKFRDCVKDKMLEITKLRF